MDTKKLKAEHPKTIGLYSSGEQIWGVPYKVDFKSTVWYPIKAFEAAGYEVPTTWDELVALSDQIVADGGVPWCNAQESAGATGWVTTDWIEDILLRTAGKEFYDKWTAHELPFNSPEVKRAFDLAGQIFFTPGYVEGGGTGILATSFLDPMDPMFNDDMANPGCWMQKQATWYGPTLPRCEGRGWRRLQVHHRRGRRHLLLPTHRRGHGHAGPRRRRCRDGHSGPARGSGTRPVPLPARRRRWLDRPG